jgi:hypothetical protein
VFPHAAIAGRARNRLKTWHGRPARVDAWPGRPCHDRRHRSPPFGVRPGSCRFALRRLAGAADAVRRSAATPKEGFTQRSRSRAHREHRETGIGLRVTGNGARGSGCRLVTRHLSVHFLCPGFAPVSRIPSPVPRLFRHSPLVTVSWRPTAGSREPERRCRSEIRRPRDPASDELRDICALTATLLDVVRGAQGRGRGALGSRAGHRGKRPARRGR